MEQNMIMPPINGVAIWLENSWCLSPDLLNKKFFLLQRNINKKDKTIIKSVNKYIIF
jgi:hypothetical protein|tara:strand:- start:309 stop:479 length:171 start_codon:yes stop_codon:yes gene_type:complete